MSTAVDTSRHKPDIVLLYVATLFQPCLYLLLFVCACVFVCVRACVCTCTTLRVCVCVCISMFRVKKERKGRKERRKRTSLPTGLVHELLHTLKSLMGVHLQDHGVPLRGACA